MKLSERILKAYLYIPALADQSLVGLETLGEWANEVEQLEAELLKFRRLDMAWGEQTKEDAVEITNLKEELGHLHSRFDRVLDDALKESDDDLAG